MRLLIFEALDHTLARKTLNVLTRHQGLILTKFVSIPVLTLAFFMLMVLMSRIP